jgi:hypothetical protein
VEKSKFWNVPMLYYNNHIPYFELCKLEKDGQEDGIDELQNNIRNEYATKMLLLFFLFGIRVISQLFCK